VIEVCDDFLGKSVFIRHDSFNSNGNRLYTVYGHLSPHEHIHPGKSLNEGDILGTLSNTGKDDGSIPHHLHISVAWIPDTLSSQKPGWKMMSDPAVVLIDPLRIIECPYEVLPDN
jgi:murein DD-endopeptidase MepM/ murein hydrolase activator NlpD